MTLLEDSVSLQVIPFFLSVQTGVLVDDIACDIVDECPDCITYTNVDVRPVFVQGVFVQSISSNPIMLGYVRLGLDENLWTKRRWMKSRSTERGTTPAPLCCLILCGGLYRCRGLGRVSG